MESPIITLTTDWGQQDFFAGMVKGKLFGGIPNVRVVDIAHNLPAFNTAHATFVVKHGCLGFPKGTIHIIDVDTNASLSDNLVVVEHQGQFLICCDNGIPALVCGRDFDRAVVIKKESAEHPTFVALDIFCDVAIRLALGSPLETIGTPLENLNETPTWQPIMNGNRLEIPVAYADSYGNVMLNITRDEFEKYRQGRPFEITILDATINKIEDTYILKSDGIMMNTPILTTSATGYLQIAFFRDSAQRMLGYSPNDKLIVWFR
ncbi:MAG: SAM-dependent chlorinase/fluorinase [Bacteroidales bacterium]|nr:SAM-dependent chlorinase/fluorinase [Bacteroidales bacterium]